MWHILLFPLCIDEDRIISNFIFYANWFKNVRSTLLQAIRLHSVHTVSHLPTASIISEAFIGSWKISINFLEITTSKFYRMHSIFSWTFFESFKSCINFLRAALLQRNASQEFSIASMKDIDCKILVTANSTVYLQFLKLCQNDQVISFGTNRKVKFHYLKMIFALKV